jgi:hypothetical protein
VQEKQVQQVRQERPEKLVILVPPALREKPEQLANRALLVRVGLLAKQALRAHQETPETPEKRVLLEQLEKVGRLATRAALEPQVRVERQVLLEAQDPPEPRV